MTYPRITEAAWETYDGRRETAKSLIGFCLIYLPHYFFLEPAEFHKELFREIENPANRFLEIIGFRGSAKSTIGSLALPLWAALEHPNECQFIVPIADTNTQAGLNVINIRNELEYNALIRQDYGRIRIGKPFDKSPEPPSLESDEEWQAKNMLLSNGVRILGRSRGQKVRGIRHLQHRPKLVVIDDPEDLKWVRTKENRDTTERWLRGEVLPALDELTGRCVLIGNNLHNDGLMARMRKPPSPFKTFEYPLIKPGEGPEVSRCSWPAKYPTQEAIELQKSIAGPIAWFREYLLKVVAEEGQIIKEEDIQYYDEIPEPERDKDGEVVSNPILSAGVGVDLAISKKQTADYTAMTSGVMVLKEKRAHIFVLPDPVNERLDFKETIERSKAVYNAVKSKYAAPIFFTEDVAYQRAAIEMQQAAGIPVEPVKVGTDKRARLMLAAPFVKNGTALFPRRGCEALIAQLLGFGSEEHDDLVDSFVHLVLGVNAQSSMQPLEVIKIL